MKNRDLGIGESPNLEKVHGNDPSTLLQALNWYNIVNKNKSRAGLPARYEAVRLLTEVLDKKRPFTEVLEDPKIQSMAPRDRAFAHAIAATTLRRKGQLDHLIKQFLKRPLPKKAGPAQHILTSAAAQLLFMDTQPHAAIDLSVSLANTDRRSRPVKGLINAVLRKVSTEGKTIIESQDSARLNTPGWLWNRWVGNYGEDTARAIANAHQSQPPLDITTKAKPDDWVGKLSATLLATGSLRLESPGQITQLPGYEDGEWWVQDTAASLPVNLLGDVADKTIIDLCAAPGGKTAQLAARGARVIAVDHSKPRLARLQDNLTRLNLKAEQVQ